MCASAVRALFLTSVVVSSLSACSARYHEPDLGGIYNRTIRESESDRNPVIVIPGILGSKLRDKQSGEIVWGAFTGQYADPNDPEGARLIALPMQDGIALKDLSDGVQPTGALDVLDISVLGLPVELGAYVNILSTLGAGGYRDQDLAESGAIHYDSDHFTCFQFAYDWRRDIVESARTLHAFIEEKRTQVQEQHYKRYGVRGRPVKFDIVAHSMGGLVARYYLMYGTQDLPSDGSLPELTWEGAKNVEKVVIVGTPNSGSTQALVELVEGVQFGPIFPKYDAAILGTMPAVYQLLPRGRHGAVIEKRGNDTSTREDNKVDLYEIDNWKRYRWGLLSPEQKETLERLLPEIHDPVERERVAEEHLEKALRRAKQFAQAMDRSAETPANLSLSLVAGDAIPTNSVLEVDPENGELRVVMQSPGDGVVLRSSALMDERLGGKWTPRLVSPIDWDQVNFLFNDHLEMTADPMFTDNVLYLLLENPHGAAKPAT